MEPRVIPISNRSSSARARVWSLQPDAVLCSAASHGNELAFSELYRRHYPSLRAFVFHLLGAHHRHEDSEDVVQDAFARAFDAIGERRFSGDFRRWIFTIARNRSIDLLRGERVRLVSLETASVEVGPQAAAEATTPVAVAETRDEVAWLVAAIDRLPERQRSALLLRELAGLSHAEIAETLDTSTGSARQLITRARDGVREAAERDGREHETRKSRSLRRELLDAVPMLPLAGAGMVVSAGTTAGGSIAFGKLVASLLAALVLAGTAGQVGKEVAEANGSPNPRENVPTMRSAGAGNEDLTTTEKQQGKTSGPRSNSKLVAEAPAVPRTPDVRDHAPADSARPDAGAGGPAREKSAVTEEPAKVAPKVVEPVKDVVELPGNVVEHVVGGLDGSTSLPKAVGNVVGEVTDTVNDVTTGLLGPGQR